MSSQGPDVTVAAVVEQQGRFLLVEERIRERLVINQPAGHVEDRETLLAAVIRETREETAYEFEPSALVGTYLWRNPASGQSTLRFAFTGRLLAHHPDQRLDTPIVRSLWMTTEELQQANARLRSPLVMRSIEDYQSGQRWPLKSVAYLDLETVSRIYVVNA